MVDAEEDNGYAEVLNQMAQERIQQLRDYGSLLAQAEEMLPGADELPAADRRHVIAGYAQQLQDFPNG